MGYFEVLGPILATVPITLCSEEATNYQNNQLMAAMAKDAFVLGDEIDALATAGDKRDFTSVYIDANILYTYTIKAIENNDLYTVSPELQAHSAAVYYYAGAEAYKKGNVKGGSAEFDQADKYLKSRNEHLAKTSKLLKNYLSRSNMQHA